MEAFLTSFSNPAISSNFGGYQCWVAPAEEAAGHPDKADAVLNAAGRFVDCYRFRADILDHRGNWPGAQAAYAQAVAIAPDLPAAYYSWGLALARHGDLKGAITRLSQAHDRGPGWADPLKAWGDVLAREGQWKPALGKYDAALKLAPAWAELHQARNAAATRAG
jgi:tetratricopeptide (TPR) repeat protein